MTLSDLTLSNSMHSNSPWHENAPPPIEPVGILSGIQIRPILVGVIVDHVATFLLGFVYLIVFFARETFDNGDISEETINKFLSSPESLFILGVIGALCTVLGGYIAGRLAKGAEVKHGVLVGLGSLVLVELTEVMLGETRSVPLWYEIASYVVTVPAGALGGYFAQRQHELRAAYHPTEGNRLDH